MSKNRSMYSIMWEKFRACPYGFTAHPSNYAKYTATAHSHEYPQLFYCLSGSYVHTVGKKSYECSPGSLIIIPPGTKHGYVVPSSCCLVQINVVINFFEIPFSAESLTCIAHLFFQSFHNELDFTPECHFVFCGKDKQTADSIFNTLSKTAWSKHLNNINSLRRLFCSFFNLEVFSLSEKTLNKTLKLAEKKYIPILQTVYYINLNYSEKILLENLTELSGICRTDYCRFFKRFFGCSYSEYLNTVRLCHAAVLCKFSPYSFSYIADICGFCDLSHMDVQMRKNYKSGFSPSELRKARKENIQKHPHMIMSRNEYSFVPPFFHSYGL